MIEQQQCTAVPGQALQYLSFLTDLAHRLQAASDKYATYTQIVQAFSHITQPASIALWTVTDSTGVRYRRQISLDMHVFELEQADERSIPTTCESLPDMLCRADLATVDVEHRSIVEHLFRTFHCDVLIVLKYGNHSIGLCTLNTANPDLLHDPMVTALLQLTGRLAASALHEWTTKDYRAYGERLLQRADRLRLLERLTVVLGHEVRNPLTSIKTFLQLAPERHGNSQFIKEFSQLAVEDVNRIEQLHREMSEHAHSADSHPVDVNMNELVSFCISFLEKAASDQAIQIHSALCEDMPPLSLNRELMTQAIINVLVNAMEASKTTKTTVMVQTRADFRPDGARSICIEIQDAGCGIAAEHMNHIFDPFFTTKDSANPAEIRGLGLTIARRIVHQHHGEIRVTSALNVGSTFHISLPVHVRQFTRHSEEPHE